MMGIENVRIDERLIHGQVANMWTNFLGATRIMVVDDAASQSDIAKASLKLATPAGVRLSVLSIEKATRNILNGNYDQQKVFLIVKQPQVLEKLINNGIALKEINIGNISKKPNTQQLARSIHLSQEDVKSLENIKAKGVNIVVQMVPNEPKELYDNLLEKEFNQ